MRFSFFFHPHSVFIPSSSVNILLLCLQDICLFKEDAAETTYCITCLSTHSIFIYPFSLFLSPCPCPLALLSLLPILDLFSSHQSPHFQLYLLWVCSPSITSASFSAFCSYPLWSPPPPPLLPLLSNSLFSVSLALPSSPIISGHAILDQLESLIFQYPGRRASSKSDH